jgi:predicted porin
MGAAAQFVPNARTPSLQIYGRMDLSVNQTTGAQKVSTVSSDTSLLGFRGAEQLGDGMTAYFKLEHGLQADTGMPSSAAAFFNRESHVGLRSERFGAIQLGSHWSPFIWITGKSDPFGRTTMGAQFNLLQGSNVRGYTSINPNSILYAAPALGPVTLRAQARLGEGSPVRTVAASAEYAKDRVYAGLAVESAEVTAATVQSPAGGIVRSKTVGLGAAYRFDAFRLFGYLQVNSAPRVDDAKGYLLGASIPAGKGEIRASVVRSDLPGASATQSALGYWYPFSPRTAVYATAAVLDNTGTASFRLWPVRQDTGLTGVPAGSDTRGFQLGVRHTF